MNTHVDFEIAKLLKEKDWNNPTLNFYFEDGEFKENVLRETTGMDYGSEFTVEFSELIENWNDEWLTKKSGDRCFGCSKLNGYFETFSAPTIAEVVMWLYEKHGIWIFADFGLGWEGFTIPCGYSGKATTEELHWNGKGCNSPTEAYSAAIKYCLTNLIENDAKI